MTRTPTDHDYRRLLDFRTGLRRFLQWSEEQAEAAGITTQQHQLLLAVRGHKDPRGPTVGDIADCLVKRHHTIVGLIDRAEQAGLVQRRTDGQDHRVVRLSLTPLGEDRLRTLGEQHLEELARMAPRMKALWEGLSA